MPTADLTTEATSSCSAPADSANSMQYEATSSVADANAPLILEPELVVEFISVAFAKAAASPAIESTACMCAFSIRALSLLLSL
ncbi:hypothetical protein ACJIZ3_004122 [Penstemon smallii]|uniref:Uncharacterized protein n=1 Tax=Penstemon smallii TaxID=265156 RepID=A0ABD3S182_9LAMI